MKILSFFEKFSCLVLFFTTFQLVGCSFTPSQKKFFPLRKERLELTFEGKRFAPKLNQLSSHWVYPFVENKDHYDLIYDQNKALVGFEFSKNIDIKVEKKFKKPRKKKYYKTVKLKRTYKASFFERARQNIHLQIIDNIGEGLENQLASYFYFFPRKYIPSITVDDEETLISLPTNEKILFRTIDMELINGPMKILNDVKPGEFPAVEYEGKHIYLRLDIAKDRVNPFADVMIVHPEGDICFKPVYKLFDTKLNLIFKFATDEEFFEFLEDECDFIPQGM